MCGSCQMSQTSGSPPACAGKSWRHDRDTDASRDHPRLCGEKSTSRPASLSFVGSPPLVRGKAIRRLGKRAGSRITPACAGKSDRKILSPRQKKDHPRLRGEKLSLFLRLHFGSGSPPLARGKGSCRAWRRFCPGITPACAGKSMYRYHFPYNRQDHPRLRGEKILQAMRTIEHMGSPPLARGKVKDTITGLPSTRITPACAGKSIKSRLRDDSFKDHPRLRGEKEYASSNASVSAGSPPLARGKEITPTYLKPTGGITPACAGKSFFDNWLKFPQ